LSPDEVRGACEQDINSILRAAEERRFQKGQEERELSGHQVLQVMDAIWPQLKSTQFRLWGDDGE
jgi:hypothetical protein